MSTALPGKSAPQDDASILAPRPAQSAANRRKPLAHGLAWLFSSFCLLALVYGYRMRENSVIRADHGIGYVLGIVGATAMLLLLLYPLRKHVRAFRYLGPIKHWFRMHMVLGVTGPILVLYHCNFQLGSINSNVALVSMLVVAGSGLIGRYIYTRIHHGLYGKKSSLSELKRKLQYRREWLGTTFSISPLIAQQLLQLEQRMLRERGFLVHFLQLPLDNLVIAYRNWRLSAQTTRDLISMGKEQGWSRRQFRGIRKQAHEILHEYCRTVRKAAHLSVHEKLFAAWHVIHMPLFIMLIITSIIHVVAVHMY